MFRMSLTTLLVTALLSPAWAGSEAQRDIVDTAVAAKSFQTLTAALKAADLAGALKAEGPFTVFAPTDAAFAKLPKGTVEQLLKPENLERLQAVLAFHVLPARFDSADLLRNRGPQTLSGNSLKVSFNAGRMGIQNASFVATDIECTNGVIHVIDTVLLPPAKPIDVRTAARQTLELAIERGVPVFNAGNAEACASIYEVAVRAVVGMAGDGLKASERTTLDAAITALGSETNQKNRAWALRRTMNRVLLSMGAAPEGKAKVPVKTTKTTKSKPLIESALPAGFPAPGPVGEAILKEYPKYRAARAEGRTSF